MSVNPYKKQKLFINNLNQITTPKTTYEAPRESLVNFPSSIMSGVTKEGGLMSLSVKSITSSELVENLDCMRQALIKDKKFEPTRIVEEPYDKKKVDELKKSVEALKEGKRPHEEDEISNIHKKLNESLGGDYPLKSVGDAIFELIRKSEPSKTVQLNDEKYSVKRNVQLNFDVDKKSEIKTTANEDRKEET